MTGRDLVSASLRLIGAIASGETPSADEATDGLASINRLIDSWSTSGLSIPAITEESPITLVSAQASYTLGAGGSLTTRPMEIVKAVIRSGGSVDLPLRILSTDEYANIPSKTIQSNYPDCLYDDGGYPQRTIKLFPVPSAAYSLVLWTKRPLTNLTLDVAISLPPGYERALVYNGAVELAPEYGKALSENIVGIAAASRADVKRANYKPKYLECDTGLIGRGRFDIFTGDYRR